MFDYRLMCKCGKNWHAFHRSKLFTPIELCGDCGTSKDDMDIIKMRKVSVAYKKRFLWFWERTAYFKTWIPEE